MACVIYRRIINVFYCINHTLSKSAFYYPISYKYRIGRHIFRYNTSRTYHASFTYCKPPPGKINAS